MKLVSPIVIGLLSVVLGACEPADRSASSGSPGNAPAAGSAAAGAAAGKAAPATAAAVLPEVAPNPPTAAPTPAIPTLVIDTFDGQRFDLSARRGKWVVVNFWATWCNPCLKEIPELNALDKAREDVEVIGLAYEEIEPAEMRAFLEKHPVEYPIAVLDVQAPPADFATPMGLPMTYVIAPNGTVARQFLGPITFVELERIIGLPAKGPAS